MFVVDAFPIEAQQTYADVLEDNNNNNKTTKRKMANKNLESRNLIEYFALCGLDVKSGLESEPNEAYGILI